MTKTVCGWAAAAAASSTPASTRVANISLPYHSTVLPGSPNWSCCRRASITGPSPGAGRLAGLLLLLPLLPQEVAAQLRQGTTGLPELGPSFLRLTRGLSVIWRDIQGTALAVLAVRDIEMWPVQLMGVSIADTSGIATTARGLREAALDHGFHGAQKSGDESLSLLTHSLILRYACLFSVSRKKCHEASKMFWG